MAIGKTTEKAIREVIKLKGEAHGLIHLNEKTGNHRIEFYTNDDEGKTLASFTLSQIVGKRYKKRPAKKAKP